MTTDELITRAQHAIQTGQPRLATLYMRKALEQTRECRIQLNPFARIQYAVQDIMRAFSRLSDPATARKSDYTLAAGRRG